MIPKSPRWYLCAFSLLAAIGFETPFDFLGSLRMRLENSKNLLPQKEGQPYDDKAISAGTAVIQNLLSTDDLDIGLPVNITVAAA